MSEPQVPPTPEQQAAAMAEQATMMKDTLSLFRSAVNGELTVDSIPQGFVQQIMGFGSALMGEEAIQEQLAENFPTIKQSIMDRVTGADVAPADNPLILILQSKTEAELAQFIADNDGLKTAILSSVTPQISEITVAMALEAAQLPAAGMPPELLTKQLADITIEDMAGLDNETIKNLVVQLPVDDNAETGFNAVLEGLNDALTERNLQPIELAADATVEQKTAAFDGAIASITAAENTTFNVVGNTIKNLFNRSAQDLSVSELVNKQIFDGIREAAPDVLKTMSADFATNIAAMTPEDLAKEIKAMSPADLAQILQSPEAKQALDETITLDFLNNNIDDFMPYALDMMQGETLNTVVGALNGISQMFPGLGGIFEAIFGMMGQFLEQIGLGDLLNTDEPDTAPEPPAPEDEPDVVAAANTAPPLGAPGMAS